MPLYLKYIIDDIFFIWTGFENEIQQFISKYNKVQPSIKFHFNYSKTQIHFLDITITKTSTGKLLKQHHTKKKLNGNPISIENQSFLKLLNEGSHIQKH